MMRLLIASIRLLAFRKERPMKALMLVALFTFLVIPASGEQMPIDKEGWETPASASMLTQTFASEPPAHTMSLSMSDGQVMIDGVPIERLSDHEIKEAIKSIAESMSKNNTSSFYEKQADYLLQANEALNKQLKECREMLP